MIPEKKHPKGLYLLFAVEMWERYNFYGMRALLILFMVNYLMFNTEKSGVIYGWYLGLVYMSPLIGGYIADRFWGTRKCIYVGGTLMAIAQFILMAKTEMALFIGLGLMVIGNGFFKPNISTMVGALYEKNDARRDGAFTIFYMGINVGAFLGPIVSGYLGQKVDWSYGFLAAGIGMIIGLITMKWGQDKFLGEIGKEPVHTLHNSTEAGRAPLTQEEKQRIVVIFLLEFFVIFFWAVFEQVGSSLTLFADRSTNLRIEWLNWEFPSSWFVALNAFFVVTLGPIFAKLWINLAGKGKEPSTPAKFAWALFILGATFLIMAKASSAALGGKASIMWLFATYFGMTVSELCISPVGLSMITKLAPAKFVSLFMGTWFFATGLANYASGIFASKYDQMSHVKFFLILAIAPMVGGLALVTLIKPMKKWMHGIH